MKRFILTLTLLLTSNLALAVGQDEVQDILAIADKINMAAEELAVCKAHAIHTDNAEAAARFEAHAITLVDVSIAFFADLGATIPADGELMKVFHRNVNIMLESFKENDLAEAMAMAELGEACGNIDAHFNNATELLNN